MRYSSKQFNPLTWIAPFLLIGLLLFPSTCAEASMVHSIFTDPQAVNISVHQHHETVLATMSESERAQHLDMGHAINPVPELPALPVALADMNLDPSSDTVALRSLPEELMTNVASIAAVVADEDTLDLQIRPLVLSSEPDIPFGTAIRVDIPPPR